MIFALLMIFAYVMFRFQWKFAAGAVAALAHDVIVTVGFFSILGLPFDLTVVAAVLAVIGYSLNDTVVAFDRIRENFFKLRGVPSEASMNVSINEMLARTIITGFTTLLVLVALLVFGGESIAPFSIALIVGIIVGTTRRSTRRARRHCCSASTRRTSSNRSKTRNSSTTCPRLPRAFIPGARLRRTGCGGRGIPFP